jgi:hypothetical protein
MITTPIIEQIDLKPCPFCGGTNVATFGPYGWYRQWGISHSCKSFYSGSQEMFKGFPSEAEAIAAWNARHRQHRPGGVRRAADIVREHFASDPPELAKVVRMVEDAQREALAQHRPEVSEGEEPPFLREAYMQAQAAVVARDAKVFELSQLLNEAIGAIQPGQHSALLRRLIDARAAIEVLRRVPAEPEQCSECRGRTFAPVADGGWRCVNCKHVVPAEPVDERAQIVAGLSVYAIKGILDRHGSDTLAAAKELASLTNQGGDRG